jgi:enoyl-CoA hydratase/carnithine racemase
LNRLPVPFELPTCTTLEIERNGAVATVWLNRPQRANAMNSPMWSELELAFTGRRMGALEALETRLVNRVFDDHATLVREVQQIARDIAAKSPLAVQGTTATLQYVRDHGLRASLDYAATWNSAMLSFDDIRAAVAATKDNLAQFDD